MATQAGKRLIPSPQQATMLPDDLVLEILILLLGEDIARCKCVCRSWRSIIRSPFFREIHRSRHGSLMLYTSKISALRLLSSSYDVPTHLFRFYYSPLRRLKDPAEESIRPMAELSIPTGIFFDQGVRIVNGLVCAVTSQKGVGLDVQLTVFNVCTGEKMAIPEPVPYVSSVSTFDLGYDPASRTYKLLRLIFSTRNGNVINCRRVRANIMTLRPSGSPSRWRKLNYKAAGISDISLPTLRKDRMYDAVRIRSNNTVGRWRQFSGDDGVLCWFHYHEGGLILFDLGQEKFRRFKLPWEVERRMKHVVGSRAQFKECGRMVISLWVEHYMLSENGIPRLECFVSEDDEGKRWSKHCLGHQREVLKPTALPDTAMGLGSSSPGEILFLIPYFAIRAVYCYSCQLDKIEGFWAGNFRADSHFDIDGTPSCLSDSNHLYLSLDDVLRGV